jgi:oligopeptide/dipeptide ABC transporter ATP-binding protein
VRLKGRDITGWPPREVSRAGVAYVPADRHRFGLVLSFSVADNLVLTSYHREPYAHGLLRDEEAVERDARTTIEEYDIRTPSPNVRAGTLSGGNQQKVVVGREFARDLTLLVLDQPTRGLDVGSIEFIHRRTIAKRDAGTAVLLVSAELDEVLEMSDRIAVMYRGRIVEEGPIGDVFAAPAHPYTALLIASAPHLSRARLPFDLEPGQIRRIPAEGTRALGGCAFAGCAFAQRCRFATEQCVLEQPEARQLVPGHPVECHHAETWKAQARSESSNGPFSYQRGALKQ